MIIALFVTASLANQEVGACVKYEFGNPTYSPVDKKTCLLNSWKWMKVACFIKVGDAFVFTLEGNTREMCHFIGTDGYKFFGTEEHSIVEEDQTGRCLKEEGDQLFEADLMFQSQALCKEAELRWRSNVCLVRRDGRWVVKQTSGGEMACLNGQNQFEYMFYGN